MEKKDTIKYVFLLKKFASHFKLIMHNDIPTSLICVELLSMQSVLENLTPPKLYYQLKILYFI